MLLALHLLIVGLYLNTAIDYINYEEVNNVKEISTDSINDTTSN